MIFSNNLISAKNEFVDGVLTDFHNLGYFGKKSAIKRIKSLQEKFSFLIRIFEYNYSFIDVPGFNGIVVICYEKNNSPDISVCLEQGYCELLINIDVKIFQSPYYIMYIIMKNRYVYELMEMIYILMIIQNICHFY